MASSALRFDGRVVLITGAGNGLGRAYALAFAERGAKVVVNDLGGSVSGEGKSTRAADDVVAEIKRKGGIAVANYDSVEAGKSLVDTAIRNFGRLDILVNNAGILRDKSFSKMAEAEWDAVYNVHLKGSFLVTRAAWDVMREQQFGRVIMTSSTSGLYGNFGQANYSAAKLGLVGLAHTLAIEGRKYNITCNAVAPTAGSRLSAGVMPPSYAAAVKPEFVAPLLLWLCHDSCTETKGIYEVGGGWVSKLRLERTLGAVMRSPTTTITPETVRDKWSVITDWTNADHPESTDQTTKRMLEIIEAMKAAPAPSSSSSSPSSSRDEPVDVVRLGCDPVERPSDLAYTYESADNFAAFPTFAVIPAQLSMGSTILDMDGFRFHPMMLLHGEQHIAFHKPMPTEGTVTSTARMLDIVDKGSGALALLQVDTRDTSGALVCTNTFSLFVRGKGGFGGPTTTKHALPRVSVPSSPPTNVIEEKTHTNQAAVYRLSGDFNPLHIDLNMAKVANFKQPILHGLCTMGYGIRHVLQACSKTANGDDDTGNHPTIASLQARFASPVFPGETLQTSVWQDGSTAVFQVKVVERDAVVLTAGRVVFASDADAAAPPAAGTANKTEQQQQQGPALKATAIFERMKATLSEKMVKKANAIFQWNIKDAAKNTHVWTVDLKKGSGEIYRGQPKSGRPGCTLTLSDDDFAQLVDGKLDPMKAFMSGKLKLSGNMMLAQKLQVLLRP
ncbi:hydroxysteroid dehydrogenase 4 [Salpingoeca rosetta]|uniref:Hydroxysteroid dehydrogenase 4 n=1 Tax=Salpingoeca rosetta (strain ATCC 50818 / BSB-021) TaxID=946362 RepID=F2U7V0_SALR5|nr:hydroxysteroid dehydrogenase 4 [Salpingoeca rosetta]EGD72855.1 hydroxysteroid dehydrogenase 4 [Salpingoeca rosetta]|eukprot:XP_004994678.1 hydroxysteroid dehydrogenase 4 [Salpingoeca rosetta]